MSHTPAQLFIEQLETYVDARLEKGSIQYQRLHATERKNKIAAFEKICESAKSDLLITLTSLMRDAKRPGI